MEQRLDFKCSPPRIPAYPFCLSTTVGGGEECQEFLETCLTAAHFFRGSNEAGHVLAIRAQGLEEVTVLN